MANAAALINESLWRRDREFQRLPRMAQCTYCQILSQKDLDTAGGLTLYLDLLVKACDELTVDQLKADFAVLEERRFLFVDYDTDELLVRSYARLVSGAGAKNRAWLSVPKNARLIASPKLRHELAVELRRLRRRDANDLADEIDPLPTPSEPPTNPLVTPSKNEGGSNPPRPVPVPGHLLFVSGLAGEDHPPTKFCPKHPDGTDGPCWACKRLREAADAQDAADAAARKAAASEAKRRVDECPTCEGTTWIPDTEPAVKCTHEVVSHV